MILSSYCEYDEILNPYLIESNKNVTSRLLVTFIILLITVLIVYFSMKSFSIKNIYDIGVYRAIGINKGSIVFIYALEILIISLKTTLVGGIVCYLITNIIAGIPIINVPIGISFELFIVSTISLILLNIVVGILPVMGYLRLTPSKILSKYDI
jgi:ABC-type antimicrobial peptide transport system permease subunit